MSNASLKPRNIILAGFMGVGKTTVGQIVADFIGWHYADTDDEIIHRVGLSVQEIFTKEGEEGFRRYEQIVCQSLAAKSEQVISTGGGLLMNENNRNLMLKSGMVICLHASEKVLEARLSDINERPLVKNWRELLESRREVYASLPYHIDTSNLSPREVAEKVVALWRT